MTSILAQASQALSSVKKSILVMTCPSSDDVKKGPPAGNKHSFPDDRVCPDPLNNVALEFQADDCTCTTGHFPVEHDNREGQPGNTEVDLLTANCKTCGNKIINEIKYHKILPGIN